MINQEDMNFLHSVREYVSKRPDVAPYVVQYASDGVCAAMDESRRMAADMEVAAFMALARGTKTDHPLLQAKISPWKGKTNLNWLAWEKLLKLGEAVDG